MERAISNMEARAAPESDRCELEAAEALAGLGRCSDNSKRQLATHSQDKRIASQLFNDYATSSRITTSENVIESLPSRSSGKKIPQSKSVTKPRLKLTEDEKEERKVRRLLANREAARQTIRRRQAMFLELNNKLAHVSEENENLKKEKELAVKEYDSLKYRNEFLKSQLANAKKAQSGSCMQADPKTLLAAEKSCSQPKPNHRSIVPCFWPHPIFPPLDVPKSLCASHSSKFPMFLYPMYCLLPCYSYYGAAEENGRECSMCSETRLREDNFHLSKKQDMRVDETCNSKKSMSVHGPRLCLQSKSMSRYGDGNIFVPGLLSRAEPQESPGPAKNVGSSHMIRQLNIKEMEDTYAATAARRRRKELMRLRGISLRHHAG